MECKRCLFDDKVPNITFTDGICSYCELHDRLDEQYPFNIGKIAKLGNSIRSENKYDCVVGVSGGCDSSYMLYLTKNIMGLNPLAVHFNNGFDTKVSKDNMLKMCSILKIDLKIREVDRNEYIDIYHSFFKAGLPDIEACTDIALMATLYEYAYKYGIKNIFVGHSFRTEGISPIGFGSYMDSCYIRDVQKKHGTYKIKTLPELRFFTFLKYMFAGIKRIRPLYYIDYDKEKVKEFLHRKFGWEWYGGLHKESIITDYVKNFWTWERYGIDKRLTELSGLIRSGQISKERAKEILKTKPAITETTHRKTIEILGFDPAKYIDLQKVTYKKYRNYKKLFKAFRILFWAFCKAGRIPLSFYVKYCK